MSGLQELWPTDNGYPVVDMDMQRMADSAARADELVHEALLTLPRIGDGNVSKRVVPLAEETASVRPRDLVVASSTNGKIKVQPALFLAAKDTSPVATPNVPKHTVGLTGISYAPIESAQFVNGDPTNPRIDLVYATLQRATTVTGTRKTKSATTGQISSGTVNLATEAQVTITILQGTPGGSPTPPTLPADSSSAWNFALAEVTIPAGFTSSTTQIGAGGSSIKQVWQRAWMPLARIHGGRYAFSANGSGIALSSTDTSDRWGSPVNVQMAIQHSSGSVTYATLDNTRDWRKRAVRVVMLRTGTTAPHAVTAAGAPSSSLDSGWRMTGTNGANFWTDATVTPIAFSANAATGALEVQFTNSPAGSPEHWIVFVESVEQLSAQ